MSARLVDQGWRTIRPGTPPAAFEEDFQTGKELAGLDRHQVRRWTSWHRWATLALLVHAFLTVTRAVEHARTPAPTGKFR